MMARIRLKELVCAKHKPEHLWYQIILLLENLTPLFKMIILSFFIGFLMGFAFCTGLHIPNDSSRPIIYTQLHYLFKEGLQPVM